MKRTQSTPAQRYVPPAEPQTTVRTITIPPEIIFVVASLMEEACRLDDEIKSRTAEIITPLQDDLDHLKSLIADIVIAGGETIRTPFGRIEYVRAGERVSWDDRALLGFAVAHPEILQMRSTKETAPAVRIKFEVKP